MEAIRQDVRAANVALNSLRQQSQAIGQVTDDNNQRLQDLQVSTRNDAVQTRNLSRAKHRHTMQKMDDVAAEQKEHINQVAAQQKEHMTYMAQTVVDQTREQRMEEKAPWRDFVTRALVAALLCKVIIAILLVCYLQR